MKVNIVTETSNPWILTRCALEIADRIDGVTVNGSKAVDINYYLPQTFVEASDPGLKVGMFTHPGPDRLRTKAALCAAHTCMNRRIDQQLRGLGYQPFLLRPGAMASKLIRFGVVGHTKGGGRKGEALVQQMVRTGFDVLGHGRGWPCRIISDRIADLPEFYAQIDYLVVPSLIEGGPMPMVDALARGVPVIAPDVGWCWEFPCIRYETGKWGSLHAVLTALTSPPSWADWAEGHRAVFAHALASVEVAS